MIIALFFILFIFNVIQYIINPVRGVFIYIFASLFFPYITVFSITFRYELVVTPVLVIATLITKKQRSIVPVACIVWLFFVVYCAIVSFFSFAQFKGSGISFLEFYNYLRFAGLIFIGANAGFNYDELLKLNRSFFFLSITIALLSLSLVAGNAAATKITQLFYTSPSRTVFDNQMAFLDSGYAFRSIGVFENVSFYASYILVILALGVSFILNKQKGSLSVKMQWLLISVMFLNLIAGISASSLTFYVGAFFILIYFSLKRPMSSIKLMAWLFIFGLIIIAFFYNDIIKSGQQYIDVFKYLYQSFVGGDKFKTRYSLSGRENGDLSAIIKSSWFFGNGFRYYDKAVVNDSLYLEFFYQSGVLGGLFLLCFTGVIFLDSYKSYFIRNHRIYLVFVVVLIAGIGCNSISIVRLLEWLWILIGIISSIGFKSIRKKVMVEAAADPGDPAADKLNTHN